MLDMKRTFGAFCSQFIANWGHFLPLSYVLFSLSVCRDICIELCGCVFVPIWVCMYVGIRGQPWAYSLFL